MHHVPLQSLLWSRNGQVYVLHWLSVVLLLASPSAPGGKRDLYIKIPHKAIDRGLALSYIRYMNKLSAGADVIINLHERGYVHDFAMIGNLIWWIQEHCFLRREDLAVLECYDLTDQPDDAGESVIFGLVATPYDAKGILIDHKSRIAWLNKPPQNSSTSARSITQNTAGA